MPCITPLRILACLFVLLPFHAKAENQASYEQFLAWRGSADTVVVDAYALEPYLHVAPPAIAEKDNALTQEQLEKLLSGIIPSRDSRVILFCWQSFMPTRTVAAKSSVAHYLSTLGYTNIYVLEDLWKRKSLPGTEDNVLLNAERIGKTEVRPYAVPIPKTIN